MLMYCTQMLNLINPMKVRNTYGAGSCVIKIIKIENIN